MSGSASEGRVRHERHDHILKIIIDNPAKKNAFSPEMMALLQRLADNLAFALESFDVTGTYRKTYRVLNPERKAGPWWTEGLPVDCSGKTPTGKTFADIRELRKAVAQNPAQLARGVTRHLVTYATGAPATRLDQPAIESIVTAAAKNNHGLRSLVHGVVQSELFRSK